jgi:hypothetical protein
MKFIITEKGWQFDKDILCTNDKEVAEKTWDELKKKEGASCFTDRLSGQETITIRPIPIEQQSALSLLYGTYSYHKAGF